MEEETEVMEEEEEEVGRWSKSRGRRLVEEEKEVEEKVKG